MDAMTGGVADRAEVPSSPDEAHGEARDGLAALPRPTAPQGLLEVPLAPRRTGPDDARGPQRPARGERGGER